MALNSLDTDKSLRLACLQYAQTQGIVFWRQSHNCFVNLKTIGVVWCFKLQAEIRGATLPYFVWSFVAHKWLQLLYWSHNQKTPACNKLQTGPMHNLWVFIRTHHLSTANTLLSLSSDTEANIFQKTQFLSTNKHQKNLSVKCTQPKCCLERNAKQTNWKCHCTEIMTHSATPQLPDWTTIWDETDAFFAGINWFHMEWGFHQAGKALRSSFSSNSENGISAQDQDVRRWGTRRQCRWQLLRPTDDFVSD